MKNILEELRDLLGYDWDYKIEIESLGFTVIISKEMYEDFEIAITYGFEDFPYVNFDKFNNYLKETNQTIEDLDYGYNEDDIKAIANVMSWMRKHFEEIKSLMQYCDKRS